ncbi:hypothetical protein D3C87_1523540 [compost metagenome]
MGFQLLQRGTSGKAKNAGVPEIVAAGAIFHGLLVRWLFYETAHGRPIGLDIAIAGFRPVGMDAERDECTVRGKCTRAGNRLAERVLVANNMVGGQD